MNNDIKHCADEAKRMARIECSRLTTTFVGGVPGHMTEEWVLGRIMDLSLGFGTMEEQNRLVAEAQDTIQEYTDALLEKQPIGTQDIISLMRTICELVGSIKTNTVG